MKEADENEERSMEIPSQFTGFNEINADEREKFGNDISMNFHNAIPSTIPFESSQAGTQGNTLENMNKNYEKNIFAYPNKGKIPEIKIKNDNYFESNENITIKDYLNSIGTYVDNQFEICEKCGTRPNYYFCDDKECKQNICEYCYQSHKKGHKLIDLIKMKKETIDKCIKEINKIFSKNYIFPKKEKEKEKEKIPRNYEIIDEARINFEIGENPMDYTSDITLIRYIKAKDYINYTHYKNIKECLNYLKKKYNNELYNRKR